MKTTITKKEKAIEIMKKMDIYKPYINGFEQKDKVRKINDYFFIDTSIFVGNDTDKRVFTPAYPLFCCCYFELCRDDFFRYRQHAFYPNAVAGATA